MTKGIQEVYIRSESDLISVRTHLRVFATDLGFSLVDVTRIVTAASELARNVYTYAQQGRVTWYRLGDKQKVGLELKFIDQGPGILDIEAAMQPGFSTGRGLGLGLPGVNRLMDEMTIQSAEGKGATITVRKWLKK